MLVTWSIKERDCATLGIVVPTDNSSIWLCQCL